jgi:predicted 3-demethylubiquinone-9 3-methyltransferase (glyoxalase superfamily)
MTWTPKRKLGRVEMDMIRQLFNAKSKNGEENVIKDLSEKFGISWEAVKRILKSKWKPPLSDPSTSTRKIPSLFDQLHKSNAEKQ